LLASRGPKGGYVGLGGKSTFPLVKLSQDGRDLSPYNGGVEASRGQKIDYGNPKCRKMGARQGDEHCDCDGARVCERARARTEEGSVGTRGKAG
jgi:hypothetical protein